MFFAGLLIAPTLSAREDRWLSVKVPEYTLITSLSEADAKAWAADFSQFIAALQQFLPVDPRRLPPLTVVVFNRQRDFKQYQPLDAKGKPIRAAGFFARRESWSVAGLGGTWIDEEVRRTIFHEGVHWFLSAHEQVNPVWLEEGLAEVFSTFEVRDNRGKWGQAIPAHVGLLQSTRLMPLEQLLFFPREELFHGDERHTGLIYAESWAWVHFLIFGKNELTSGALTNYLQLVRAGLHPDNAFRQSFGGDYKRIDEKFASYLRGGEYFVAQREVVSASTTKIAPATPQEKEVALSRLALGAGRPDLAADHAGKAITLAPEDATGYALLGQIQEEAGKLDEAVKLYAGAVERHSPEGLVYYRLGRGLRLQVGEPGPALARQVATWCEKAINLNPYQLPAFQELACALAVAEPFHEEDRSFLDLGHKLYPGDGMIRLGLAVHARKAGDVVGGWQLLSAMLEDDGPKPREVRTWMHQLNEFWIKQDYFERADKLVKEGQTVAALGVMDEALAKPQTTEVRAFLTQRRRALEALVWRQDYLRRAEKLVEKQKPIEALVILEEARDKSPPGETRNFFMKRCAEVGEMAKLEEARLAWGRRDLTSARRILTEVVEGDMSNRTKMIARQKLAELDRQHRVLSGGKDQP